MRRVILESPYAGDVERNVAYARRALRDSLLRGEAPIASHLLYTQPGVLDDANEAERRQGIDAGLAWGTRAEATVVYIDHGISRGMHQGIARARLEGRPVEMREIGEESQPRPLLDCGHPRACEQGGQCQWCAHVAQLEREQVVLVEVAELAQRYLDDPHWNAGRQLQQALDRAMEGR